MESVGTYLKQERLRNNINLEENTHSSEDDVSHYTLTDSEDDKIILKDDNPYLHDNVD